jgi:hypothetical protein
VEQRCLLKACQALSYKSSVDWRDPALRITLVLPGKKGKGKKEKEKRERIRDKKEMIRDKKKRKLMTVWF